MPKFKFELNQPVAIAVSDERGTIIGRAEYADGAPNNYWIRYQSADQRAVEAWWSETALRPGCATCDNSGRIREPYAHQSSLCPDCTTLPISSASATTDASVKPAGNNA